MILVSAIVKINEIIGYLDPRPLPLYVGEPPLVSLTLPSAFLGLLALSARAKKNGVRCLKKIFSFYLKIFQMFQGPESSILAKFTTHVVALRCKEASSCRHDCVRPVVARSHFYIFEYSNFPLHRLLWYSKATFEFRIRSSSFFHLNAFVIRIFLLFGILFI